MTQTANTIGRRTNLRTAAIWIGIVGAIGSLLWGGWAAWQLTDDFGSMARTEIPGKVTVDVAEPGEKIVYYERDTLYATPVDPNIEVSVSGPNGSQVASQPTARVQYRVLQNVRQPHVSFPAMEEGSYTVTADGRPAHEGATIAVGPRIGLSSLKTISGPIAALLASIIVVAWGSATRGGRRTRSAARTV